MEATSLLLQSMLHALFVGYQDTTTRLLLLELTLEAQSPAML